MTLQILYPDAQFDGEPTAEAQVFGPRAALGIYRVRDTTAIPEAVWRCCDAIVCYHDVDLDESLVAKLDLCRLIVRAGVGYDQIDIEACAARGHSRLQHTGLRHDRRR
jgi:D-3-phosphoglycerate dehydrogenase/C-terminal binding protein